MRAVCNSLLPGLVPGSTASCTASFPTSGSLLSKLVTDLNFLQHFDFFKSHSDYHTQNDFSDFQLVISNSICIISNVSGSPGCDQTKKEDART